MPRLMAHLVANFPNPDGFAQALNTILSFNVDYLEIQLPFSHPVADGPTIHQANQVALNFSTDLATVLNQAYQAKQSLRSSTKLILMSYLTPLVNYGLPTVVSLLQKYSFLGLIVPDLAIFTLENQQLVQLTQQHHLQWIPVISSLTTTKRIQQIKAFISPTQLIYATLRVGQTGKQTLLEVEEVKQRLVLLKAEFPNNVICIGFGIKDKEQVDWLNQRGFVAVIGSQICQLLSIGHTEDRIVEYLSNFLQDLGFVRLEQKS